MGKESSERDFLSTLRIIRRRTPLVALCCVLTAAAAFAFSKHQRKQYTATAQVYFRTAGLDQQAAGLTPVYNPNQQAEADTNLKLATLPKVAANTATILDHGITTAQVASGITVTQVTDTQLANVSGTWTSPEFAAMLANTYARQIVATRQQSNANYYANALRAVNLQFNGLSPSQKRGIQGTDLKDRAASLQILSQLQSSDVQVQQLAHSPTGPSSPKVARNTALGGVLGLLLGVGLAFLLHRLDLRLHEPTDLEEVYGVPLVGVVPESSSLNLSRNGGGESVPSLSENDAEIFGLLRAHIRYFNVDRELRVVVVVSAAPGDGKTTVASNLAFAAAIAGSRVMFVESDLRRPMASRYLGVKREPGLSEVLGGTESLDRAVQHVEFASRKETRLGFDVLVAGGVLPPNPPQVIESQAMESVLEEARRRYDLVIVDTPPLAVLPDAFPLLRHADGVLIVSRLRRNRSDVAARFRGTLESANAPVIGVVANGFKRSRGGSSYGYGYQYDYSPYDGVGLDFGTRATTNGAAPEKAASET
jgi:capsular exopolysaccharide synthesis family protein